MKEEIGTKVGIVIGMTVLLTFPVTLVSGAGGTKKQDGGSSVMSKQEFTAAIKEAVHHAQEADAAGAKGDTRLLTAHARKALEKAKEGQRAGHNERLNEGVYALGEAIEHGNKQEVEDATEHVKHAIMKLSQSAGLQIPEGVPTGERSAGERMGG